MRKRTCFLLGTVGTALVALSIAIFLLGNAGGFNARTKPSALETWMARKARSLAVPANARELKNPVPKTPEVLAESLAHWADHCAICHANNGSGETSMGKSMYPPAPDMRLADTQQMTDGELFYIIENGIRFTGMPGWGMPGHDTTASWKLVQFIRHLPDLSFAEKREMERLNPKGPDEWEEERLQEEFLRGEDTNDGTTNVH